MSLPPPQDMYGGEPQYPSPWTTRKPREGLRDNDSAHIICLAPDVCKTPVGSSIVPIPYQIVDYCGHDALYTDSVRFTSQKVMVLRAHTTHVHGDKPGEARGIKSGTVEDICEPVGHAAHVRAEGSPVIRHLDRFKMNNGNTEGEAIFIRDTGVYAAPLDTDPVRGSLAFANAEYTSLPGSMSNPRALPPGSYQVAQNAGGSVIDAGGGLFGGASQSGGTTTSRPVQIPSMRRTGIWAAIVDALTSGGVTRAQITTMLSELDYYATTPGQGLTSAQMSVLGAAAGEIRGTALPAGDYDAAQAIKDRAWGRVFSMANQDAATTASENVRVSGAKAECDDICKFACECMQDRGGAATYTECVARKLREKHYDPNGPKRPDGTPRYPKSPNADGPRPEVSYDPENGYRANPSNNVSGMPSSQYPVRGMPRPDISWWKDGKLWKIFELKFPTSGGDVDGETPMQASGEYERIAQKNGLNPKTDSVKIDVAKDCDCSSGTAKPGAKC